MKGKMSEILSKLIKKEAYNFTFDEIHNLLQSIGFNHDRTKGDHYHYKSQLGLGTWTMPRWESKDMPIYLRQKLIMFLQGAYSKLKPLIDFGNVMSELEGERSPSSERMSEEVEEDSEHLDFNKWFKQQRSTLWHRTSKQYLEREGFEASASTSLSSSYTLPDISSESSTIDSANSDCPQKDDTSEHTGFSPETPGSHSPNIFQMYGVDHDLQLPICEEVLPQDEDEMKLLTQQQEETDIQPDDAHQSEPLHPMMKTEQLQEIVQDSEESKDTNEEADNEEKVVSSHSGVHKNKRRSSKKKQKKTKSSPITLDSGECSTKENIETSTTSSTANISVDVSTKNLKNGKVSLQHSKAKFPLNGGREFTTAKTEDVDKPKEDRILFVQFRYNFNSSVIIQGYFLAKEILSFRPLIIINYLKECKEMLLDQNEKLVLEKYIEVVFDFLNCKTVDKMEKTINLMHELFYSQIFPILVSNYVSLIKDLEVKIKNPDKKVILDILTRANTIKVFFRQIFDMIYQISLFKDVCINGSVKKLDLIEQLLNFTLETICFDQIQGHVKQLELFLKEYEKVKSECLKFDFNMKTIDICDPGKVLDKINLLLTQKECHFIDAFMCFILTDKIMCTYIYKQKKLLKDKDELMYSNFLKRYLKLYNLSKLSSVDTDKLAKIEMLLRDSETDEADEFLRDSEADIIYKEINFAKIMLLEVLPIEFKKFRQKLKLLNLEDLTSLGKCQSAISLKALLKEFLSLAKIIVNSRCEWTEDEKKEFERLIKEFNSTNIYGNIIESFDRLYKWYMNKVRIFGFEETLSSEEDDVREYRYPVSKACAVKGCPDLGEFEEDISDLTVFPDYSAELVKCHLIAREKVNYKCLVIIESVEECIRILPDKQEAFKRYKKTILDVMHNESRVKQQEIFHKISTYIFMSEIFPILIDAHISILKQLCKMKIKHDNQDVLELLKRLIIIRNLSIYSYDHISIVKLDKGSDIQNVIMDLYLRLILACEAKCSKNYIEVLQEMNRHYLENITQICESIFCKRWEELSVKCIESNFMDVLKNILLQDYCSMYDALACCMTAEFKINLESIPIEVQTEYRKLLELYLTLCILIEVNEFNHIKLVDNRGNTYKKLHDIIAKSKFEEINCTILDFCCLILLEFLPNFFKEYASRVNSFNLDNFTDVIELVTLQSEKEALKDTMEFVKTLLDYLLFDSTQLCVLIKSFNDTDITDIKYKEKFLELQNYYLDMIKELELEKKVAELFSCRKECSYPKF